MYYILSKEYCGDKLRSQFVCDTVEDLKDIKETDFGDIAIVVGPPSMYLRNSQEDWVIL